VLAERRRSRKRGGETQRPRRSLSEAAVKKCGVAFPRPRLNGSAFVAVHQPIRNALGGTDSLRSHCPGNANACESRWLGGASRDALSDSRCPATNAGAKRDGCAHVDHWRGVGGRAAQRCLRGGARHTGATARYHPGPKVPST
jgi:hypothetical protein